MGSIANLEKLGLNEAEAAIFVFLTQHGASLAPQIQAALDMPKVATYRALNGLIARQLVITTGEARRLKYVAEPVKKLLDQYDRNIKELHDSRDGLEAFIDTLAKQQNELYKERKIQVYEGTEGLRLWFEERLRSDVNLIREIANNRFWEAFAPSREQAESERLHATHERVRRGIHIRSIFTGDRDLPPAVYTQPKLLRETRYWDVANTPSLLLSVFGNRLGYFSGDGITYRGLIIDDPMLASLLTIIFDVIWEQSEIVS